MNIDKIKKMTGGLDPHTKVFRIFKYKYLLSLFESNLLTLVNPLLWDDPFENVLCKVPVYDANNQRIQLEFFKKYYGICWTEEINETDAQWRIYAPECDGVRLSTTIAELLSQVAKEDNPFYHMMYRFCSVTYFDGQDIVDFLSDPNNASNLIQDNTGLMQFFFFLTKRNEFMYEREIRLIINNLNDEHTTNNDLCFIPVNANALFRELIFDPRLNEDKYIEYSKAIHATGYTGVISQSNLYQLPDLSIHLMY